MIRLAISIMSIRRLVSMRLLPAVLAATALAWAFTAKVRTQQGAISQGSADLATAYYRDVVTAQLGLSAVPDVTTIDDLLAFVGYRISADDLLRLDSSALMDPNRILVGGDGTTGGTLGGASVRVGDVLAMRFFAPKIANVAIASPVPGWRKLVRLKTRPDSAAAKKGVDAAIILFNFFAAASKGVDPYAHDSANTQVMLVAPAQARRLYWLDFQPNKKLGLALNATFDAAVLPEHDGKHDYFVPDGCNNCHGSPDGSTPPMINYLDTDHWFDRLNDDFPELKQEGMPALLFDAATNDSSQPPFHRAFDSIRQFNEEALRQNSLIDAQSFETAAGRTWLRKHANSDEHFAPVDRAFSRTGAALWQPSEASGLGLLNRYCFRCHGSVFFSVFEREEIVKRAGVIQQHIDPRGPAVNMAGFKMPPDRVIPQEDLARLTAFLLQLK